MPDPQQGERRRFGDEIGEWDGRQWLKVEPSPAPADSAAWRYVSNAVQNSPVGAVYGLGRGAVNAATSGHPLDYLWQQGIVPAVQAQVNELKTGGQKALEAVRGQTPILSGVEALGHTMAGLLPFVGPAAAHAGEQIVAGDVAGGLGATTGLLTPFAARYAREVQQTGSTLPTRARVHEAANQRADYLAREANDLVARRVLAPANPRYRGLAQKIAPEVLDRGLTTDTSAARIPLLQAADRLIADSGEAIDTAMDAKGAMVTVPGAPMVAALDDTLARHRFAGTVPTAARTAQRGTPLTVNLPGEEVNPLAAGFVAKLTELRDFLARRGDLSAADARRLRGQLDEVAAQAGAYAGRSGSVELGDVAAAATETANTLRHAFAQAMPELRGPNADMTLGLALRDVLDPTKGRPMTGQVTTGATGGMHTTGAIIGNALSNVPGIRGVSALVASKLLPAIREWQVSPGRQLATARAKYLAAEALRRGDWGRAAGLFRAMAEAPPRPASEDGTE